MSKAHRLIPRKAGSSPQSRAARNRAAMATQQDKGITLPTLNFLLGHSDATLDTYELARLDELAHLRAELHEVLDRVIDTNAQAIVIRWFRGQDRNALRHAIENEETAEEWAHRMMRDKQRSPEELLPLPSLPPGAAHLAAAKRYQERNLAEGKCRSCPKPLAHNSVEYCEEHLAKTRARDQQKKALSVPGSREYLYAGETPSTHGRALGTLASLARNREKKTREVLAELGIKPEDAAVTLRAAKEALLRVMPDSKAKALPAYDLFQAAQVPTSIGRGSRSTTGYKALKELLAEGKIESIGKGVFHDPVQYWATGTPSQLERPKETKKQIRAIHIPEQVRNSPAALDEKAEKDSGRTRVNKNEALVAILKGDEPKARELVDPSAPKCPRCGAVLIEKGETRKWKRYFECGDCCLGFELVMERHREPSLTNGWFVKRTVTLQPGRTKRDA